MDTSDPIYLDCHSTTPVDDRVLQEMMPYFGEKFGNAASRGHAFGWEAEEAVDLSRERIAGLIGAEGKEIIFTSGATEANNLALKGFAEIHREQGGVIVTQATEHHAVLDPCRALERAGFQIRVLPTNEFGQVDPDDVRGAIDDDTILVSVMLANNEIGTLQDLHRIGEICRERGVRFHTDATQGVGKIPLNVDDLNIDLLSLSGHKMYAPKGVGALYVRSRPRVRLVGEIDGGGHERGLRSGTLNVPGIVGLGSACELSGRLLPDEGRRTGSLRDHLQHQLFGGLEDLRLNGHPTERLPGNLNVSFAGVDAESLMMGLPCLAVSSGSACTSASLEPSYVLRAIGVAPDVAQSSLRFGIGRMNTAEQVGRAADLVCEEVRRLRKISPYAIRR